jgi:hypothetical protein
MIDISNILNWITSTAAVPTSIYFRSPSEPFSASSFSAIRRVKTFVIIRR